LFVIVVCSLAARVWPGAVGFLSLRCAGCLLADGPPETIAVLLAAYIAIGAPMAQYVPGLRELTFVAPKEKPLTKAEIERREREALRKEQEEEYEATLMEDRVKQAEEQAKQDKIDAARREREEAENAKKSVLSDYMQHVESAKERLSAEPAEGVLLRLRCPDGLQLTRKFAKDSPVGGLYDFIDVERYTKACKVSGHVCWHSLARAAWPCSNAHAMARGVRAPRHGRRPMPTTCCSSLRPSSTILSGVLPSHSRSIARGTVVCLHDANLRDANLRDACLRDACLRDACLRDACLLAPGALKQGRACRHASAQRGAPGGAQLYRSTLRAPAICSLTPRFAPVSSALS